MTAPKDSVSIADQIDVVESFLRLFGVGQDKVKMQAALETLRKHSALMWIVAKQREALEKIADHEEDCGNIQCMKDMKEIALKTMKETEVA